ncbi:hypothetical protein GSI_14910 [Ganoderma sinense ZZ0214-1]|uniref:Uncharacterized protein n=1 Tax=Ganoderma sinense ZZ0214-1 TaxID=1077348 RepID=A0A2G8RQ17_9APHY|nr:hypothetical protein GSI_14910 [Ganoderma sinense ZZ0214-1]
MQFSRNFSGLALFVLALAGVGMATPVAAPGEGVEAAVEPATYLVSYDEMLHWLATTDAELTYVGAPINPLVPRAAQNTIVTYCNKRANNVCGGSCSVYNGGAACIAASGTNCLAATHNVAFCDRGSCGGTCNQLDSCGTRLDNGFCYTPGTNSILVSSA